MSTVTERRPKTKAPVQPAKQPLTAGELIDKMFELREARKALEAQAVELSKQAEELEAELMTRMETEKVDKMTGRKASVSVSSTVVGNVEDWDKFLSFIYLKKAGHLLQRRVSDPAYRELLESLPRGKQVPGVMPFTKKRLNLRVLSS